MVGLVGSAVPGTAGGVVPVRMNRHFHPHLLKGEPIHAEHFQESCLPSASHAALVPWEPMPVLFRIGNIHSGTIKFGMVTGAGKPPEQGLSWSWKGHNGVAETTPARPLSPPSVWSSSFSPPEIFC